MILYTHKVINYTSYFVYIVHKTTLNHYNYSFHYHTLQSMKYFNLKSFCNLHQYIQYNK